MLFGFGHL